MKKLFIHIFLFLTFPFLTYAQGNYKPGYVVNIKNDTLKGYINYKEWELNPKTIAFKSTPDEKVSQKFGINDINSFAISNLEYYEKAIVHVSKASIELASLPIGIDTSYAIDTVFLKVLIKGKKVSLYVFTDDNKTRFYVKDQPGRQINELNYYLSTSTDNTALQTIYQYRTQLDTIVARYKINDRVLNQQIDRAKYKEPDLLKIIASVNGGDNNQIEHKDLFGIRFFAGAGVSYNKLVFQHNGTETTGPFPYGAKANSTYPMIAGGIELLLNKYTQVLIFRLEATFTQSHYDIPYTVVNLFNGQATLDFKQFNASFIPQVIYNCYSGNNLKVFIDGGLAINVSSYNKYFYLVNNNNVSSLKTNNYPEFDKGWLAVPLKIGIVIDKRIEIYGRYIASASLNNYGVQTAYITSYQAGINYLFEK